MLLLNRLNGINDQIDAYQEQVNQLQRQITQLQNHAQEVQGVEQSAESAIAQVRTALEMLSSICPDEILTFKTAIDGLFESPNPLKLTAAVDDTTQPSAPNPPDEPVDVESTPVVEQPEAPEAIESHNGNGKAGSHAYSLLATVEDLKKCDRPKLIKLANKHQIPGYQNKTRDKLAELLSGKVTVDEVTPALSGKGKK